MNLLSMNAIDKAPIPMEYMKDIKYLWEKSEDPTDQASKVFEYGRIVGIQQERARRQGRVYEKPILINGFFMEIFKFMHEAIKDFSDEEMDKLFDDSIEYANNEIPESFKDKFIMLINDIITLEKIQRKEAFK